MSIAKNVEITSSSEKSFEEALQLGVKRMAKTVDNIESVWVKEQKVKVTGGKIKHYRVTMIVTFVVKE